LRQADFSATGCGHSARAIRADAAQRCERFVYALELFLRVLTFLFQLLDYCDHVLHWDPRRDDSRMRRKCGSLNPAVDARFQ
jgi:hypothetical protein